MKRAGLPRAFGLLGEGARAGEGEGEALLVERVGAAAARHHRLEGHPPQRAEVAVAQEPVLLLLVRLVPDAVAGDRPPELRVAERNGRAHVACIAATRAGRLGFLEIPTGVSAG
jgi:hypothetical protein